MWKNKAILQQSSGQQKTWQRDRPNEETSDCKKGEIAVPICTFMLDILICDKEEHETF